MDGLVSFFVLWGAFATDNNGVSSGFRPFDSIAGEHAVWVFLTDKGGTTESRASAFSALQRSYEPRAVERRLRRRSVDGLFDERDLPVERAYLDQIVRSGPRLRVVSSWLNAVSVDATDAQIETLRALPFVRSIEPVRRAVRASATPLLEMQTAAPPATRDFYGLASEQLTQIGVVAMHQAGFTGQGVIIGVLDTGFNRTHVAYNQPGHVLHVIAEHDFVSGDDNAAQEPGDDGSQHSHGTLVLSTMGAYLPEALVGGAYDAAFILAKTEDITQEVPIEEDHYVAGLEFIESHGGDMATSSLGYIDWYTQVNLDGHTAVTTIAVNTATDNGLVCCTAAGNSGHDDDPVTSHLLAPADAFLEIACGAVDSGGTIAGFSSDGPSADGRVKPEALARGVTTYCIWPYDDTSFASASGTSLATPLVASAVALLIQAHPDWTVRQIRTALLATAGDYAANHAFDPLYVRGYGVINVFAASQFCHGDLNGNRSVGLEDLARLLAHFGQASAAAFSDGDLDLDGDVDLNDLAALLGAFGHVCP